MVKRKTEFIVTEKFRHDPESFEEGFRLYEKFVIEYKMKQNQEKKNRKAN